MSFQPKFTITNQIANDLTQVVSVKDFLDAARLSVDWISEMQDRALVLEAYHTTHIEGSHLTFEQSAQLLQGETPANIDPDDQQELINYRGAFDLVAEYLGSGDPVTEELVREIHKSLVKNLRGNSAAPGAYRKIQNYVVNSQTGETIYTPPPAFEIPIMMQALVDYLNQTAEVHPVLVAGIAQFQLVHIHPFLDGNGRTARLLSTLCLYRKGYDFKKLFTISEYYDRNRTDYYKAIQSVRNNNMDMTAWLEYFTHALATQMRAINRKSEAVIKAEALTKQHDLSERQAKALQHIFQYGELTIKDFQQICPATPRRSLQRDLKDLIDKQLVISKGATNQLIYMLAL